MLFGIEGIEYPAQLLAVHSDAVIFDPQIQVSARLQLPAEKSGVKESLIDVCQTGGYDYRAAVVTNGIHGVGNEAHQYLPQLDLVATQGRQISRKLLHKLYFPRNNGTHETGHIVHHFGYVHGFELDGALAGIDQHLGRQIHRLTGTRHNHVEILSHFAVGRELAHGQAGIAQYARQHVVEVMSDTPCEHAQTLELLRLRELPFEAIRLLPVLLQPIVPLAEITHHAFRGNHQQCRRDHCHNDGIKEKYHRTGHQNRHQQLQAEVHGQQARQTRNRYGTGCLPA